MGFPGTVHRYSDEVSKDATITTTDATVTTLWTRAIPTRTNWHIYAIVLAMQSDGSQRAVYERTMYVYRADGTADESMAQVALPTYESAGAAAWAITLDVSSNAARLQVTGAAATTIKWRASFRLNVV